ncbi:MAG TPA: SDR family oxidoreductase [Gammaproteobacteria bacterium]|nr:SDR family oxidoreductase [Gammaproteobacteria bacterium]
MPADLFSLDGRVALVTGASSGLGRHFAATLAGAGARVALCARSLDRLEQGVNEIHAVGGEGIALPMDVRDADSVAQAFDTVRSRLGTVTVLVNNSGVAGAERALEVDEAGWDRVLDTNLKGAWRVAQTAAKQMVAAECGGSIINVASILAFRVAGGVSPYAASKAGLVQLTRALALELARHRIRVNAIAPGYFATEMNREFFHSSQGEAMIKRIPQRRAGDPVDLDGALLLLASDASAYMTGSVIVVDGGHLCSSL